MTGQLRLLLAGLAAVAVLAAVVAVVVTDPFSSSPSSVSGPVPAGSPAPQVSSTVNPALAPAPPASGAYFGAWVGPDVFTQANEIHAVQQLQNQLGRKLAIVHTYLKWQAPFPTPSALTFLSQGSMLLISWAGTDTGQVASGADDGWIRTRARQIKALGKPVFLEWRWEMDRPNLRSQVHSGAEYVAAWDHIRAVFAQVGVQNAAWVWCPTANGFADGQAAAFYPGNSEVDWICADAYPAYGSTASFASTVTAFLGWASHYPKPVMIGEFGVPESDGASQRAQWLRAARQVVQADPQIKALLYFDANPAGQGPQGSYSLAGDAAAMSAFRAIAAQPYFNPAVTR
jgi:Glycosyl hydrolase family 26